MALAVAALSLACAFGDGPRRMIGTENTAVASGGAKLDVALKWAAEDGETVITPWQTGSNECVYVIKSSHKLAGSSFPDVPVVLDNDSTVLGSNQGTLVFPQMTINSGAKGIMINAEGTLILKGGFTVPSGVTFPLSASGAGNKETPRDVTMNGTLTGQSDSVVQYSVVLASAPNVNPALSTSMSLPMLRQKQKAVSLTSG